MKYEWEMPLSFRHVPWPSCAVLFVLEYTGPIHHKVWDKIIYPFRNFNGTAVEVLEWISNFIPHFTVHVINYPCWG